MNPRHPRTPRLALGCVCVFAGLALGCATDDVVALLGDGAPAPTPDGGGQSAFCAAAGPTVQAGDQVLGCGARFFRYALCSCSSLSFSGPVSADAFDSRDGPYTSGGEGGSVASHGSLSVSNRLDVTGDVVVEAGASGSGTSPTLTAGGLRSGGAVTGFSELNVAGDAFVDGDVNSTTLSVGGTLTVPPGAAVSSLDGVARLENAAVEVPPPCSCDDVLDIAAEVRAHQADNDNAAGSVSAGQLVGYVDGTRLALGCGRYYFHAVSGAGALELVLSGRTAIYIDGDIQAGRELRVTLSGPAAEVDLFVRGTVSSLGPIQLGDVTSSGRARLFVGGGSLDLTGRTEIAGHLYAPRANLQAAGAVLTYGSAFIGNLATAAPVTLHFDRASMEDASCP